MIRHKEVTEIHLRDLEANYERFKQKIDKIMARIETSEQDPEIALPTKELKDHLDRERFSL